ncbi:hypothetical protein RIF29_25741 [Crotalaria pallida]|uniref:Uncharacterized protein n=1 Tax=Crotalaria pallida TaxID=3830 RepID=A0AAN9EMM0_CROPI
MRLSDEEAAVADYIFGKSFKRENDETYETDDTEVLVRANVCKEIALTTRLKATYAFEEFAFRSNLKTLMPGKLVSGHASFIEDMLLDESFYDFETPAIAKRSDFEIDILEEGQWEEDMS